MSLCNCAAPPTLSLNLSTPLCIRLELGLLGARWLLPKVVVFFRYFKLECSLPMQGWLKLQNIEGGQRQTIMPATVRPLLINVQRETIMPHNYTPTPNHVLECYSAVLFCSAILQSYSTSGVVLNNRITKLPLPPCFFLL